MTQRLRPTVDPALILEWRIKRTWSQKEAANTLGVSYRAYQIYETVRCPRLVWMAARYYDLTHKKAAAALPPSTKLLLKESVHG